MLACLHCLALNEQVQDKIRREVLNMLPNNNSYIDGRCLSQLPYMKAFLKEVFRWVTLIFIYDLFWEILECLI